MGSPLKLSGLNQEGIDLLTDFLDAHERHLDDAKRLYDAQRWANADHLYGIAAECGLKRLMLVFGMPWNVSNDTPRSRDDKQHIDAIWDRYESYRSGDARGAAYVLAFAGNPFRDWKAEQRYAHKSNFDEARVKLHQEGAQAVCTLILKALNEGRI